MVTFGGCIVLNHAGQSLNQKLGLQSSQFTYNLSFFLISDAEWFKSYTKYYNRNLLQKQSVSHAQSECQAMPQCFLQFSPQ